MIILTLHDPQQQTILKQWQFEQETIVQIGRAEDNQVVLDASCLGQEFVSLISRYHLTLQQISPQQWQMINRGSNGTFINGNAIQQSLLPDGTQFQLARGGPILKFQLQQTAQIPPAPMTIAPRTEPLPTAQSIATPAQLLQPQTTAPVLPVSPPPPTEFATESATESAQIASLQAQLAAIVQERDALRTTLQEIQAQFPATSLTARQADLTIRSTALQQLIALLQREVKQLQSLPGHPQQPNYLIFTSADRDRVLNALMTLLQHSQQQQTDLRQAQSQIQSAVQAVETLNAHLQTNRSIAAQLNEGEATSHSSNAKTRIESLTEQIEQRLQEFDRELARIQELQQTENAKQFFSL